MTMPAEAQTVEFRSAERSQSIVLQLVSLERDGYPSIQYAFDVQLKAFRGRGTAWVAEDTLRTFAAAVAELDRTRTTPALLESMSPSELHLSLSSLDSCGHVLLEFSFMQHTFVGDRRHVVDVQLSGGFELESTSLGGLAEALDAHLRAVSSRS